KKAVAAEFASRIPALMTTSEHVGGLQLSVTPGDTIHARFTGIEDVITLKDGSILRGMIIESIPDSTTHIQLLE
ncbi:MAG TPA: hypothetical protein DIT99_23990, partial [Candidatus Latescibacteria bacterium]|nr:hypothetical protein [Candidatus Latescibacterota bacterium]